MGNIFKGVKLADAKTQPSDEKTEEITTVTFCCVATGAEGEENKEISIVFATPQKAIDGIQSLLICLQERRDAFQRG